MSDASTGSQTPGAGASEETAPDLVITKIEELVAALTSQVTNKDVKQGKNYNKSGFKGVEGLSNIANPYLAVMAAACIRQIALNGGADVKALLGTDQKKGVLSQFCSFIIGEAEAERRLTSYMQIAEDLGIERGEGESASAFVQRIKDGYSAKK